MIQNFQRSIDYDGRSSNRVDLHGGAGRIYITSPSFGVDISPEYVRASMETESYGEEFLVGVPRQTVGFLGLGHRVTLQLEFEMPFGGLSMVMPTIDKIGDAVRMGDGTVLLIDGNKKPPPPRQPLWLPGGVWNCEYCSSVQISDLLQCRNCGAPRWAEEAGKCWGNPR